MSSYDTVYRTHNWRVRFYCEADEGLTGCEVMLEPARADAAVSPYLSPHEARELGAALITAANRATKEKADPVSEADLDVPSRHLDGWTR